MLGWQGNLSSHVISFPQITDTEGDEDEDEDGLDYDFRWHRDGF